MSKTALDTGATTNIAFLLVSSIVNIVSAIAIKTQICTYFVTTLVYNEEWIRILRTKMPGSSLELHQISNLLHIFRVNIFGLAGEGNSRLLQDSDEGKESGDSMSEAWAVIDQILCSGPSLIYFLTSSGPFRLLRTFDKVSCVVDDSSAACGSG